MIRTAPTRGGRHRPGWPRLLVLGVATLLAASACHGSPAASAAGPTAKPGTDAGRGSAAGATTVRLLARYPVPEAGVSHLTLWSHYLAFATAGATAQTPALPNQIKVIDTNTGTTRTVARSAYPTGLSDWLGGTGDWLVWTDQPREQDDSAMDVTWTMHLTNLVTGTDRVIASSTRAERLVPLPSAGDGYVAWAQLTAAGTGTEIRTLPVAGGPARVVVADAAPSSVTVSAGYVVYDGDSAHGRDVFEVPVTGGTPIQVSTSGHALYPQAAAGRVVWQEPPDGDPDALWQARLGPAPQPAQVLAGTPNHGNAVPGTNFVVFWNVDTATEVVGLTGDKPARAVLASTHPAAVPPRLTSSDNRVAWAEFTNADNQPEQVLITLAQVSTTATG